MLPEWLDANLIFFATYRKWLYIFHDCTRWDFEQQSLKMWVKKQKKGELNINETECYFSKLKI